MPGLVIFGRKSSNSQDENLKPLTLKNRCRVGWYGSIEILEWAILFNMRTHPPPFWGTRILGAEGGVFDSWFLKGQRSRCLRFLKTTAVFVRGKWVGTFIFLFCRDKMKNHLNGSNKSASLGGGRVQILNEMAQSCGWLGFKEIWTEQLEDSFAVKVWTVKIWSLD